MLRQENYLSFIQRVEKSEFIICIGAGQRLQRLEEIFEKKELLKKVRYVADNALEKQGTEVNVGNKKIVVQSVESLIPVLKKQITVIITCLYYYDVLEQLNNIEAFDKTDIFLLTYILGDYCDSKALKKEIPPDLRIADEILIPKVIHYCWFGGNPIPDRYQEWMRSWKKYCPDYEIVEWNESNYDFSKNQYMLNAYEQKKWGFVPDYARLDIIYNYGGIYLDTDVELIKNIDDLLYQRGFVGFESGQYVNLGIGFGAVAGNTYIKEMRDAYDNYTFVDEQGQINLTASPVYQTQFLLKKGLKLNGEYQVLEGEMTVFPEKMLSGKSLVSRKINLSTYTRAIHHFDGSWLDDDKRKMNLRIENDMNNG